MGNLNVIRVFQVYIPFLSTGERTRLPLLDSMGRGIYRPTCLPPICPLTHHRALRPGWNHSFVPVANGRLSIRPFPMRTSGSRHWCRRSRESGRIFLCRFLKVDGGFPSAARPCVAKARRHSRFSASIHSRFLPGRKSGPAEIGARANPHETPIGEIAHAGNSTLSTGPRERHVTTSQNSRGAAAIAGRLSLFLDGNGNRVVADTVLLGQMTAFPVGRILGSGRLATPGHARAGSTLTAVKTGDNPGAPFD